VETFLLLGWEACVVQDEAGPRTLLDQFQPDNRHDREVAGPPRLDTPRLNNSPVGYLLDGSSRYLPAE